MDYFSLVAKPITRCKEKDIYFQKHILFSKMVMRTVNASDFEYSLNRLLDEKSLLPGELGFKAETQNQAEQHF
jgi:hypothetical protein